MITTSTTQYLHPDLPPMASNSDAKKSPLAMLVQTCSAIGKDMSVKPLVPVLGRIATSSEVDNCKKPRSYHESKQATGRQQTPKALSPPSLTPVELTKTRREIPSVAVNERRKSVERKLPSPVHQHRASPRQDEQKSQWQSTPDAQSHIGQPGLPYHSLYPQLFPHMSHLYQAELVAHLRLQAEKAGAAAAAGLYFKAAASCRDPYCASCQLARLQQAAASMHSGYAQCGDKVHNSTPPLSLLPTLPPALLASLYPVPTPLAASGLPHVCNWIDGTEYCGKRFASTDDLLQHIKSHTTDVATVSSTLFTPYSGLQSQHENLLLQRSHNFLGLSRHHPYGKPHHYGLQSPAMSSIANIPPSSANFFSAYSSLYGSPLGAAASP